MDRLKVRLAEAIAFARTVEEVRWTPEAMTLWEPEYPRLTTPRPGAFGKATGRAEAHALRLALLSALLDRSAQIKPDHLQAALAVWDYAERSARYIFGDSTGDRDADRILQALRAAPDGMTRYEIQRGVFGGHKSGEWLASKLAMLLRLGVARMEMATDTGGRHAELWHSVRTACAGAVSAVTPSAEGQAPPYRAYRASATPGGVADQPPAPAGNGDPTNPSDPLGIRDLLDLPVVKPFYVDSAGVASKARPGELEEGDI
jgi:hypothetical protein